MLRVTVNGRAYTAEDGWFILDVLRSAGVVVPTLCYDERMQPYGGCRLCVVEVKGRSRPVTACDTPVSDGMSIETHSQHLEDWRRTLLGLLAGQYPAGPVQLFPTKKFHRLLRAYGMEKECRATGLSELVDDSNPYIRVDMSQCIYCYRCVRICEELQGQFVWQVWNRGDASRIRPDSQTTLRASSCVSCGACVDTCPTGALEDKSVSSDGVPHVVRS